MIELLTGIALGVVGVLAYRQTKKGKKAFFTRELRSTQEKIWSLEFARFTTTFEYEKYRKAHDTYKDQLQRMKASKASKEEIESTEKKLEQTKKTMDEVAMLINGTEPNEQMPNGYKGVSQDLENTVQKRELISEFIKQYC